MQYMCEKSQLVPSGYLTGHSGEPHALQRGRQDTGLNVGPYDVTSDVKVDPDELALNKVHRGEEHRSDEQNLSESCS